MKTRVNIENIYALKDEINKINELELPDIDFYENGELLNIDPARVERFKYIGLNNVDFIMMDFHKSTNTICPECCEEMPEGCNTLFENNPECLLNKPTHPEHKEGV